MYPPDDTTRPCRPKAGQGQVIIMMMMTMMMMGVIRKILMMMKMTMVVGVTGRGSAVD